ncbi:MAG: alanine racemase [Clostridia bacterium]|nr:alanine racemase [Clostridia bacterium]
MTGYNRAYAKINLNAISSNFDAVRAKVGADIKVMAVVKADAYGHGSVEVARLLRSRADYFGVATLSEGIELRCSGIENPILVLGYTSPMEYEQLLGYGIMPTIYNVEEAELLSRAAEKLNKTAKIHVAVDTGMSRIGFRNDALGVKAVKDISLLNNIQLEGIFTHYATADEKDKTFAREQAQRFDDFIALLEGENVNIPIKHISNSAGAIEFSEAYDMVRLGIALYGLYPSDEVDRTRVRLTPAMEVISHVIHVKTIEKGTGVGYGQIYVAEEERRIATVAIGYADGFNRCLTGKGYVLIGGRKAPLVGKVCMDQIMVDVTDIPDVRVGDKAVILGRSGNEEITADELGAMCHSFSYEIICTFMPRIKRIY